MDRILVPFDFSVAAINTLQYAYHLSEASGMALSLMYCYAPEAYNRKYDFGKKDYTAGIREMLRDYYEKFVPGKPVNIRCIARPGSVSEGVAAISKDFKLIVLSSGNFNSKIVRWASSRTSAILSAAKCPVLIVPLGKKYSDWTTVWHIQRNENDFDSIAKYLPVFGLQQESIAVKTFKQTSFQSVLWKSMFFYLQSHEPAYNKIINDASAKEKIDLAMLVSTDKGSIERYNTVEILQLLMRSHIPALIFKPANQA